MISTICSHTMRQKSPKVFGKGPEEHRKCYRLQGCGESRDTAEQNHVRVGVIEPLTLSCNVGVALLVPIHETGIDVI